VAYSITEDNEKCFPQKLVITLIWFRWSNIW